MMLGYCYQQSQLQLTSDTVISYFQPLSPQPTLLNTIFALPTKTRPATFYRESPGLILGQNKWICGKQTSPRIALSPSASGFLVNDNSKCSTFIQLSFCRLTQHAVAPRRCSTPTHNWTSHSTAFSAVKVGTSLGAMVCNYGRTDSVPASTPWE